MNHKRWHLLIGFLFFALAAAAQTPDTTTLHGQITDPTHAAVSGATVTATNSLSGLARTANTDAQGNFTLAALPVAGTYTVTVEKTGFATGKIGDLTFVAGATARLDLPLAVAGSSAQTVNVTGTEGQIRSDSPELGDTLSAQQLEETPLFNDQITYALMLNSANRQSINMGDVFMNQALVTTNGGGRRQTTFTVDGANSNDDWARQTIFTNIPEDAVEEMSILENAFSAQYSNSTGGAVDIVTKSGGQQYHGELDYAVRPNGLESALVGFNQGGFTSALASGALSGNDQTTDEFNHAGFAFSGPAGEHTQFFVSGEFNDRHRASPVTSPVDPENYIGVYHDGMLFGRVDHQFSSRHTMFVRYDEDRFFDTNPNGVVGGNSLPTVARIFNRDTYEGELGDTFTITPNLVNNFRYEYQLADPITEFSPVDDITGASVVVSSLSSTFTSGASTSAKLINHQNELNDTVATTWGRHQVLFGGGAILGTDGGNSQEFGGPNYLGTFTFAACPSTYSVLYCESTFIQTYTNATSFTQAFGLANYDVSDNLYNGFIQDNFQMRSNLTVNLGLRYDRQTYTDSTKDFAPRIGFAWSPRANTVVRGGYGIYYSQIIDDLQANFALDGPTGVFNFTANNTQPGFPTSLTAYSSLSALEAAGGEPACGLVSSTTPCLVRSSIYVRPGMASYYSQYLPMQVLQGYQNGLWNPYSQQWTLGIEHHFAGNWDLSADYVGSHTLKIERPVDLDAPPAFNRTAQDQWRGVTNLGVTSAGYPQQECNATQVVSTDDTYLGGTVNGKVIPPGTTTADTGCAANAANAARPLWIYDAAHGLPNQYEQILSTENDGIAWYDALEINLNHRFSSRFQMLASYTWSHILDTVDQDATAQSPNDSANTSEAAEEGNALFNQPQRFVVSGRYQGPWQIAFGGVNTMASGLQFNPTTGSVNGGNSGAETDRPVVNGVVVARNSGRGTPYYSFDPFVERPFQISERTHLDVRAEAFNAFNHGNFASFNATYGNTATAPVAYGTNSFGVTSQFIAREFQFSAKLTF